MPYVTSYVRFPPSQSCSPDPLLRESPNIQQIPTLVVIRSSSRQGMSGVILLPLLLLLSFCSSPLAYALVFRRRPETSVTDHNLQEAVVSYTIHEQMPLMLPYGLWKVSFYILAMRLGFYMYSSIGFDICT